MKKMEIKFIWARTFGFYQVLWKIIWQRSLQLFYSIFLIWKIIGSSRRVLWNIHEVFMFLQTGKYRNSKKGIIGAPIEWKKGSYRPEHHAAGARCRCTRVAAPCGPFPSPCSFAAFCLSPPVLNAKGPLYQYAPFNRKNSNIIKYIQINYSKL